MSTTPISATLAQTDRDAVLQAITTIKEKLPFLVDLSADDRKTLPSAIRCLVNHGNQSVHN
ncbi:MAG: hypothetical protein V7L31_20825 [Nostoc sp.]|uniref:hypothetical protein n=1 Tax=Nostoc sp. TaxID=1180 RepID=UPI002FF0067E